MKRAGNGGVCQGLVGLCRQWRRTYPLPDPIVKACSSLPPGQALTWKSEVPADPTPSVLKAVRDENTSALGPQSSSETHDDSYEVVSSWEPGTRFATIFLGNLWFCSPFVAYMSSPVSGRDRPLSEAAMFFGPRRPPRNKNHHIPNLILILHMQRILKT